MTFIPIHLDLLQILIHHLQVINITPHAILLKLSSLLWTSHSIIWNFFFRIFIVMLETSTYNL
jgi:hypothetical protein